MGEGDQRVGRKGPRTRVHGVGLAAERAGHSRRARQKRKKKKTRAQALSRCTHSFAPTHPPAHPPPPFSAMAFTRALFLAALVAAASAARPVAETAPAAAVAEATAPVAAAVPEDAARAQAVYARALEVTDADRAAAAPIVSFLKRIPQPPGEWEGSGRGWGERVRGRGKEGKTGSTWPRALPSPPASRMCRRGGAWRAADGRATCPRPAEADRALSGVGYKRRTRRAGRGPGPGEREDGGGERPNHRRPLPPPPWAPLPYQPPLPFSPPPFSHPHPSPPANNNSPSPGRRLQGPVPVQPGHRVHHLRPGRRLCRLWVRHLVCPALGRGGRLGGRPGDARLFQGGRRPVRGVGGDGDGQGARGGGGADGGQRGGGRQGGGGALKRKS